MTYQSSHLHNMRTKSKWLIAFVSLMGFAIYTYRYNFLSVRTTANTVQVMFGSRVTISFHKPTNMTNVGQGALKNKPPTHLPEVKILLWSQTLRNKDERQIFPNYGKAKRSCPVKYHFVYDRKQISSISGVIVDVKAASDLPQKTRNMPWILLYDQPPLVYRVLENKTFMQEFNYSIGYRMDSDFPNPKISEPEAIQPLDFHQKYDYIAAIFSNCTKLRTDYVRELSKYSRVKSYGKCLRNVEKNNIARIGEENYIASKKRLTRLHKFTLSLMKFDCHDYVDDTLNHAWEAGSLPLFLGTESLRDMLPKYLKSSFIQISQFTNAQHLAEKIQELINNKEDYKSFMSWRTKNKNQSDTSPMWRIWTPSYSPGCQIAMAITENRSKGNLQAQKTLKPITCSQRDTNKWLGKNQKITKVTDD